MQWQASKKKKRAVQDVIKIASETFMGIVHGWPPVGAPIAADLCKGVNNYNLLNSTLRFH